MTEPERVLFVHAHPDDETITTGGTLATLVDRGASVTVVTCTRGEKGEVIPDDLQFALASPEKLASLRESELRTAMRVLGVDDHRFLGDEHARWLGRPARRYSDSGMRWGASGAEPSGIYDPSSLSAAEFGEVAADIAAVIVDVAPDVVISYDADGGYGHPDHVRAHQAARRAAEVYGLPFFAIQSGADARSGSTVDVDVSAALARKRDALLAYPSQVTVDDLSFTLSNGDRQPIGSVERYRRIEVATERTVAFSEQKLSSKIFLCVVAVLLGAASGALLTVYHQNTLAVGKTAVPIGLIAAILLVIALDVGSRLALSSRVVTAFVSLSLAVVVGVLSLESRGGSVLIPGNQVGLIWTVAPTAVAIVVLAWPNSRRRAAGRIATQARAKGPQLQ